ncbi:amino acid ABC transporter permease [Arthrobacter agilis]|uniref:amino acid ABC transporter permease n=1 Tax=Arthrobacter agilis TaxID=37921 RepID=UPI000B353FDD|nr:amino acid ABC transporter permease [Arthrobacter agilis]OUM41386.1 amino acid ABC transporter permease [Arthrobacter agilis]PPB46282.1 amino acid ABC transporter permease [Arthrobacter agilis]TPV27039.1 amino acid ABC transporter permease [Arthrobacter agilis]VDR32813.1 Glutamate/aspartate transport system permease protein gltK [Arthrobacter agilis]
MSAQQVLFDAPGPRARRVILIGNIVGVLIALAILWWVVAALAERGQLTGSMWSPFLESRTWQFFILPGLLNTLQAAGISIVTAVAFGLVFGVGRLSNLAPVRWIAGTVVEFFRAVPVLLMMIFFWLALGRSGVVQPQDAPFIAVIIALTLYNGSVIAELVRSGVHGLPRGQREAGMAIGLTRSQSLRTIEVPQALVAMLPALVSQFVVILKDSALGFIITYPELLQYTRRLGVGEGNVIPSLLVAATIFIVINFALSTLATRLSVLLSFRAKGQKPVAREALAMDASSS